MESASPTAISSPRARAGRRDALAARPAQRPALRSAARLALLALVALLPLACNRDDSAPDAPRDADELIRPALSADEAPPTFDFPDDRRSKNDDLNAFIDELRRIFTEGRYREYRLSTSRLIEPVERRRFEGLWHAVRAVRVELIKRLPESLDLPPPAYAVLVSADVRENYALEQPHRIFAILVFKEEGQWVIAPAPENVNRAMRQAANLDTEPDDPFADDAVGTSTSRPSLPADAAQPDDAPSAASQPADTPPAAAQPAAAQPAAAQPADSLPAAAPM